MPNRAGYVHLSDSVSGACDAAPRINKTEPRQVHVFNGNKQIKGIPFHNKSTLASSRIKR